MLWESVTTCKCYWPTAVEKLGSSERQTEPLRPNIPLRARRTYLYSLKPYNCCSDLMRWESIGETRSLLQTTYWLRLQTCVRITTFIFHRRSTEVFWVKYVLCMRNILATVFVKIVLFWTGVFSSAVVEWVAFPWGLQVIFRFGKKLSSVTAIPSRSNIRCDGTSKQDKTATFHIPFSSLFTNDRTIRWCIMWDTYTVV